MNPAPLNLQPRPSRLACRRRSEGGWVLAATLILSTLAVAVTVTYARHAVLAKKSLEFAKGASEVEEAARSGLQRVRERMRRGNKPGTVAENAADYSTTPGGETVIGEREVKGHDKREVRVNAQSESSNGQDDEANIRSHVTVAPGSGTSETPTSLHCEDGEQILLAGNLQIIDDWVEFHDTELAGLFLLEEGATLELQNVILRGTIITRAGLCNSNPKAVGENRPHVFVRDGLRLLAGTELPDVAVAAPDLVFEADGSSTVEIKGFVVADELLVEGQGVMTGMAVTGESELISPDIRRPGHGREPQAYPEPIEAGAELVTSISFPVDPIPEATLDLMLSTEIE